MSYLVLVTDSAKNDLEGIADYVSETLHAPIAAGKLMSDLENAILSLSVMPERYPVYTEEPWQSRGVRKMNEGNYNIYYAIENLNVFRLISNCPWKEILIQPILSTALKSVILEGGTT